MQHCKYKAISASLPGFWWVMSECDWQMARIKQTTCLRKGGPKAGTTCQKRQCCLSHWPALDKSSSWVSSMAPEACKQDMSKWQVSTGSKVTIQAMHAGRWKNQFKTEAGVTARKAFRPDFENFRDAKGLGGKNGI